MGKPLFNAHSHIFDFTCVPDQMSDKWPLSKIPIGRIVASKAGRFIARAFSTFQADSVFSRYLNFFAIGMNSTQEEIFNLLQKNYANLGDGRFVILPMDMEFMGVGKTLKPYRHQLYDLIQLRIKYPDKMLPFLGIHPERFGDADETLAFVKEHIGHKKPFVGIKLYPATGYYPDDPRLDKMYDFAQENNIPITSHCTSGPTHYLGKIPPFNEDTYTNTKFFHPMYYDLVNGKPKYNKYFVNTQATNDFQQNWTNPYLFQETVLKKYPLLKINFAHFGGASRMKAYEDNKDKPGFFKEGNWYYVIRNMLENRDKYPNVYTDISYTLTIPNVVNILLNSIRDSQINSRILFGTDYYVVSVVQYEEKIKIGFFEQLNDILLLRKIASENVHEFLTSNFYKPF